MRITATEAKNRFGALCLQAKQAPVVVEKAGRPDTVILSYTDYQRLVQPRADSLRQRRARFVQQHREWIDALNRHQDEQGLWSDGLRAW